MRFVDNMEKDELWDICTDFVQTLRISCAESVHQSDRVIENAYELIEKIAEKVGYYNDQQD